MLIVISSDARSLLRILLGICTCKIHDPLVTTLVLDRLDSLARSGGDAVPAAARGGAPGPEAGQHHEVRERGRRAAVQAHRLRRRARAPLWRRVHVRARHARVPGARLPLPFARRRSLYSSISPACSPPACS